MGNPWQKIYNHPLINQDTSTNISKNKEHEKFQDKFYFEI